MAKYSDVLPELPPELNARVQLLRCVQAFNQYPLEERDMAAVEEIAWALLNWMKTETSAVLFGEPVSHVVFRDRHRLPVIVYNPEWEYPEDEFVAVDEQMIREVFSRTAPGY